MKPEDLYNLTPILLNSSRSHVLKNNQIVTSLEVSIEECLRPLNVPVLVRSPSQAAEGPVSTKMGDPSGIPGVVGFLLSDMSTLDGHLNFVVIL